MSYSKIIKKWSRLRYPDKKFEKTAFDLYKSLTNIDKARMLKEFEDYIDAVDRGDIIPSPPELPKEMLQKEKINVN